MAFPVSHLAIGIFLTLMLSHGTVARPEYGQFYPGIDIPQYTLLDETETMDDAMYSDMKKYPESNPAFMHKSPWLRAMMSPSYIDEEIGSNVDGKYERVPLPEVIPTPLPLKKNRQTKNLLTDHGKKKDVHYERKLYMSPCHFKICNMGRKRNARYVRY